MENPLTVPAAAPGPQPPAADTTPPPARLRYLTAILDPSQDGYHDIHPDPP